MERPRDPEGREPAFDLARAVAIVWMVLINFQLMLARGPLPTDGAASRALRWWAHVPSGRSSSLFVVLAGVGITLLTRFAREAAPADRRRASVLAIRILLLRSLVLAVAGFALWHVWSIDILHFYACYLLIAALLLWWAPIGMLAGIYVLVIVVGVLVELGPPMPEHPFRSPLGFVLDALFVGVHPVFPWLAFLVAGITIGRLELRDPRVRRRLLVGAALAAISVELLSLAMSTTILTWPALSPLRRHLGLFGTGWTPDPLYVIGATATATVVITVAHELAARPRWLAHPLIRGLIATGQLALSIYVTHAVIGVVLPRNLLGWNRSLSAEAVTAYWAAFCTVTIAVAALYRRFLPRGPLEWAMRAVTSWRTAAERALGAPARPAIDPGRAHWPAPAVIAAGVLLVLLLAARVVGVPVPGSAEPEGTGERVGALSLITQRRTHDLTVAAPSTAVLETFSGLDVYLELDRIGPDGSSVRIAEDDDSGEGTEARIETALDPGRYRVTVRPYAATTGPYLLDVHLWASAAPTGAE